MKLKKILALVIAVVTILSSASVFSFAKEADPMEIFQFGIGPETEGYSIDYRYFSPVKKKDKTKYPLVIYLHGMGDGAYDGKQISSNNDIIKWTTDEFQSRFKDSGGAFIFVPRSVEEQKLYWDDKLVYPLRATIDDFIRQHKKNIDPERIYVGGYSMGGKMTFKLAMAYPDMFAALFPICPAWIPGTDATKYIADIPVWMVSSMNDPFVMYYNYLMPTWQNVVSESNVPENCRLSTQVLTLHPDGKIALSGHFSWYSVSNDLFSSKNGPYPLMKTQNGLGEEVKLTYPDGMISWLSGFRSDFDVSKATDSGNSDAFTSDGRAKGINIIVVYFKNLISNWLYLLGIK